MFRPGNMMLTRSIYVALAIVTTFLMTYAISVYAQPIRSPDGKTEAKLVQEPTPKDSHYQVREIATNKIIFTTFAQYSTPNDVKAGLFSPDSKQFAAAYHYGHAGKYTWIGVWSVDTGKLVHLDQKPGWIYDIKGVFAP